MTDPALLVAQHRNLVADQVRRVLSRVPSHVDRHDLRAAAEDALVAAARTFRPRPGTVFADHALAVVRVALRDRLRSLPATAAPSGADVSVRLRIVEGALAELPASSRAVVTSYFLRSEPVAVIARDLGISEEAVRALVSAALAALRDALNAALRTTSPGATRPTALSRRRTDLGRRTTAARFEYASLGRGPGGAARSHR